ncbi:PREDICTED: uncharacterized protein LOC109173404 [Ipomoea nil]|uniref:uncharacterized protein LOC109173404 n=1 Tax=Ipomoea nil TaxID=35883 RepID=UPI00090131C7|nr:PREDICTED: uncharacterized protein LOC109173404 [Ipomoea nil]
MERKIIITDSQAGKEWRSKDDQGIHWKAWDKVYIPKKYGGLGFKELRAFNLAMLGKQAWRFLTQPESLVSRVYKAKYYPNKSFFDACLGNNPSFCWRSILATQELICGGVKRRIGNGKLTLIWDHPWLHDEQNPRIITEKPPQLAQAMVMGLMDQETGTWDQDILTDIFIPVDVIQILKISVSPEYEDMWYWYGDPRGEYLVKIGYRKVVGDHTHQVGAFDKWLKLWKFKIPLKWKTFLWRTLNDILPTHYKKPTYKEDDNEIVYAVALLYYIWRARNGAVWDAYLPTPRKIIAMVTSAVHAWKLAHPGRTHTATATTAGAQDDATGQSEQHNATAAIRIDQPQQATAMLRHPLPAASSAAIHAPQHPMRDLCFFDAAYSNQTNKATVGAIQLNAQGGYISAMSAPMIDCFSPLMAEAFACKEVLSWLRNRGERSIELFTDCLILQQYLSSMAGSPRSYLGYAIDSCKTSCFQAQFDLDSV